MIIGIIFGVFDMLHVGHIVALQEAKSQCDYLIVGLKTDSNVQEADGHDTAQTMVERFIKLEGCQFVDEIIPFESDHDITDMLQSLPVHKFFIGEDYKMVDFSEIIVFQRELKFVIPRTKTDFQVSRFEKL